MLGRPSPRVAALAFIVATAPVGATVLAQGGIAPPPAPTGAAPAPAPPAPAARPSPPGTPDARGDGPGEALQDGNVEGLILDTTVQRVAVDARLTVVTMGVSPGSPCASNHYVYGRERPKWQYQTGRLMQAWREGAVVRVSFSCRGAVQSIDAIQFLSPPRAERARLSPGLFRAGSRARSPRPTTRRSLDASPSPSPSGAGRANAMRR